MIIGGHSIIYSTKPEADRAFFRDVLKLTSVDVGHGWLIFGLPPAEIAVHPAESNGTHEFFLMCDDAAAFVDEMQRRNVSCEPIQDQGYGIMTRVTLPGGGTLGVYQPRHARPKPMSIGRPAKKTAAKRTKPSAKKSVPGKRSAKKKAKRR